MQGRGASVLASWDFSGAQEPRVPNVRKLFVLNPSKQDLPFGHLQATMIAGFNGKLGEITVLGEEEATEDNCGANRSWGHRKTFASPLARPALAQAGIAQIISFDRDELRQIFNLYGRKVCDGEWRDYGIDFTPQKAVFSIYRRACECALYRIEKSPWLARKQGTYSVVAATGLVLKRGHDLSRVITVLDRRLKLVSG
jgi:Protein of unknown function (DUF2794)